MVNPLLFFTRLGLLLIMSALPAFLPATRVYADAAFLARAFFILPASFLIGWLSKAINRRGLNPRRAHSTAPIADASNVASNITRSDRPGLRLWALASALALPFIAAIILGPGQNLLASCLLALYGYISSFLAFRLNRVRILYIELPYFAYALLRMLSFSRSSQQLSQSSSGIDALVFAILFAGLGLYAAVIFASDYRSITRRRRSFGLLASAAALGAIGFIIAAVLPPDFVQELERLASADNILQNQLRPADDNFPGDSNQGSQGTDGEGQLYLMSPDGWSGSQGAGGDGSSQYQYMVMIVDSPRQPVYLADEYFGTLDGERGFGADPNFFLNQLTHSRYIETWQNPDVPPDYGRTQVDVDIFSTISDRVSSYLPLSIEPTLFDSTYRPLNYNYRSSSSVSRLSLENLLPQLEDTPESYLAQLEEGLGDALQGYRDIALPDTYEAQYRQYAAELFPADMSYSQRILTILRSFSDYQYELGFSDEVNLNAIGEFLFSRRSGDCTEFSNAAALLARLAGIPSRVVTGYLVAENLQSRSHKQAIDRLQQQYAPISDRNPANLYLVTSAHRHSWPQFYLPGFGWVDFEATSYAIPPPAGMDPNSMDLVIPDIREVSPAKQQIDIPWLLIGGILLMLACAIAAIYYITRWVMLLVLMRISRRQGPSGAKALYRLLLTGLAARGYELKEPSTTPEAYARRHPELEHFVRLYLQSVYTLQPAARADQKPGDGLRTQLIAEYKKLMKATRRPGTVVRLLFSPSLMRYLR